MDRLTLRIESDQLPELSGNVKSLINDGSFFLYKMEKGDCDYILEANQRFIYRLGSRGEILSISYDRDIIEVRSSKMVYFSDLPFPPSLSRIDEGISANGYFTSE